MCAKEVELNKLGQPVFQFKVVSMGFAPMNVPSCRAFKELLYEGFEFPNTMAFQSSFTLNVWTLVPAEPLVQIYTFFYKCT